MGFVTVLVAAVLFIGQTYSSNVRCQTVYGSTPKVIVQTRTTTKTALSTWTSTVYTSTLTTTTSITNTYISLKGSATKTVPVGPSFTPIASAPTSTSHTNRKRTPAPEPILPRATSSYPQSVACTKTITRSVEVTASSEATIFFTTYPSKVVTSLVPTQTVYAACARDDNALTDFGGQTITDNLEGNIVDYPCGSFYDGYMAPRYGINTTSQGLACRSRVSCCEIAQSRNYTGYGFFEQLGGHICLWTEGKYNFASLTNGYITPGQYGNGPSGTGTFVIFAAN